MCLIFILYLFIFKAGHPIAPRHPRMDDEEDDVFEPDSSCWRSTFREIKCKDQGTQTPGPALAPHSGMLPCGVAEEPRPLFYGEARSDPKEKKGNSFVRTTVIKLKP